ncbi:MAG: tetratricopeptide repeat protein [Caldiserica bacterium]|nr:tetratricopeptide repeat protein [Caldisericota bacterium]
MNKRYLFPLLLFLLSLVVYVNTVKNGFVYDDNDLILKNPQVKEASIKEIFSTPFWGEKKYGLWRPITVLSFRLNYLMKGFSASLFHLSNIILHSLTVLMLYFLFLRLTAGKYRLSFISALLYAVHPVHTEAVAWIVGRSEILSALFLFTAFIFLIQFHQGEKKNSKIIALLLSGLFFILSLLSKETGITLPLLYSLYLVIFQRDKIKHLKTWTGLIYLLFLLAVYIHLRINVLGGIIGPAGRAEYFYQYPRLTPLFTLPLLFFKYIKLSFFPFFLSVDYTFAPITHASPLFFSLLLFFFIYISAIIFTYKRVPLVSFSLSFFLIALLPYLHIVPIGWLLGERFLYLPTAGICLLLGIGLENIPFKERYILASLLLLSFSMRTYTRNFVWKDKFTLWNATTRDNPHSVRAYYNLGVFYQSQNKFSRAKKFYAQAKNKVKGEKGVYLADIYNNWGLILGIEGKLKEAEKLLRQAIKLNPYLALAHLNLGNVLISQGKIEEAITSYSKSAVLNPSQPLIYKNLAWAYFKKGDLEKSEEYALKFINEFKDIPPSTRAEVLNYLATIYFMRNDLSKSEEYLREAISEDPDIPISYLNYGNVLMKKGNYREAEKMFLASLKYGGPKAVIYRNLGLLLYREGKWEESREYWEKSLRVDATNPLTYYYLGLIFEKKGDLNKAVNMWRKSLHFNPSANIRKIIAEKLKEN